VISNISNLRDTSEALLTGFEGSRMAVATPRLQH
jgi:hypothetical protein